MICSRSNSSSSEISTRWASPSKQSSTSEGNLDQPIGRHQMVLPAAHAAVEEDAEGGQAVLHPTAEQAGAEDGGIGREHQLGEMEEDVLPLDEHVREALLHFRPELVHGP